MTYEQKILAYRKGLYACPPPPVCTRNWSERNWIKWVDNKGVWT